jgi:molybdopterin-synthase adenylyltransferase
MNNDQLLRYSRQIMLPAIGIAGQEKLLETRVLIVGLGGLGSPAAMYLAAAGVGTLVLADFDKVDLTNLQRQIIHTTARIGQFKVESAQEALLALNPEITIETHAKLLDESSLTEQVKQADIVLDGTDNFSARYSINKACRAQQTPLVSAAAIRMEGQVTLFSGQPGTPCYHCLYPDEGEMDESCSANGVLAPIVGILGSIQATEAIKYLTGAGTTLEGKLLLLDALQMEWRTLKLKQDPACPVCSTKE